MKQHFAICLIVLIFSTFALFIYKQKQTNTVLEVITPNNIIIDFNNNSIEDDNETVCINNIETFSTDLKSSVPENINLTHPEFISLGYLAQEFSYNLLYEKSVKFISSGKKTPDCIYGDILFEDKLYSNTLINEGLAWSKTKIRIEKIQEQLLKAKSLDLVILNHKSNKYHKLDCKYGVLSHDYVILPKKQLTKEMMPCKFCLIQNSQNKIPVKQHVSTTGTAENIKIILSDYTKSTKPDKNCKTETCKELVTQINKANKSIDIAMYGADNIPKVYNALLNAKNRGIDIRIVYDKPYDINKQFYKETDSIVRLANKSNSDYKDGSPSYTNKLMHNKFIIFDNNIVWTGSLNFSYTDLSDFNANNVIIINSKDVANLYSAEFNQMLNGKFHEQKQNIHLTNNFVMKNGKIQVYFSPYNKSMKYVIPYINKAQKYIYMPVFLITHKDLTSALIQAKQRGVDIRIIIDANNVFTTHSTHKILKDNKIDVKTEIFAGKMHSKSIIIDDKYIITGSMNFSNSGENKNDENLLIIENKTLATFYKEFFLYLWDKIPNIWLYRYAHSEGKESIGSCQDGIDNDFDGLIDMTDPDCKP